MRGSVRTSSAGPSMNFRPCSITSARSEIKRAPRTFCSTIRTVTPAAALETFPRRQALDGLAPEHDLAIEQAVGAVDGAQQRRLAGAIAADQGGDGAGLQARGETAHDRIVAIACGD